LRFWTSTRGVCLGVLLVALAAVCALVLLRVDRTTSLPRKAGTPVDLFALDVDVQTVGFRAADGVELQGWLLRGEADRPPLVLCHDRGSSKESLINLAITLHDDGFSVLLFDFRGHGRSEPGRSTLGLYETRDVVGAVEFALGGAGLGARWVGVYGVGMGAYAAVLAAAKLPAVKVLVLDSLYPDVSWPLDRAVYGRWSFASRYLDFLPRGAFRLLCGVDPRERRAADAIGELLGREVLLLAPANDSALLAAMQRMYETIPDQVDVDGNLVVLPATHGPGLYGEQLPRYHERVSAFFVQRLLGHG